jgi:hypothetical protein
MDDMDMDDTYATIRERVKDGQKVVVVLDLDGTLMATDHGHPIFFALRNTRTIEEVAIVLAPHAEKVGCIRPGVGALAKVLCTAPAISHIVLCTSASDDFGYVTQAIALLRSLHGPSFPVLQMDRRAMIGGPGATLAPGEKDMSIIRTKCVVEKDTLVVVIEDHPKCVVRDPNTVVLSVPSYKCAVDQFLTV